MDSSSLVSGHVIALPHPLPSGMPQRITAARVLVIDFWVKPKSHEISFEASNYVVCDWEGGGGGGGWGEGSVGGGGKWGRRGM